MVERVRDLALAELLDSVAIVLETVRLPHDQLAHRAIGRHSQASSQREQEPLGLASRLPDPDDPQRVVPAVVSRPCVLDAVDLERWRHNKQRTNQRGGVV